MHSSNLFNSFINKQHKHCCLTYIGQISAIAFGKRKSSQTNIDFNTAVGYYGSLYFPARRILNIIKQKFALWRSISIRLTLQQIIHKLKIIVFRFHNVQFICRVIIIPEKKTLNKYCDSNLKQTVNTLDFIIYPLVIFTQLNLTLFFFCYRFGQRPAASRPVKFLFFIHVIFDFISLKVTKVICEVLSDCVNMMLPVLTALVALLSIGELEPQIIGNKCLDL